MRVRSGTSGNWLRGVRPMACLIRSESLAIVVDPADWDSPLPIEPKQDVIGEVISVSHLSQEMEA
jgi:hypothetical protein